jgi:hypothetical protein
MGKVISMRLSDAEEARVRGAAALTGLSTSAYLKWLLVNGKSGTQDHSEMVLRRLDELGVAIAKLAGAQRVSPATPSVQKASSPDRAAFVRGLKDRGVPSSTIRQVEAVLDAVNNSGA